jgi:hypothetical protein
VQRQVEFYNLDVIISDREFLTHAGRISHEMAQSKADLEYGKFKTTTSSAPQPVDADFERAVSELPPQPSAKAPPRLKKPRKP